MGKRSSPGLAFLIQDRPVEAFEQLNVPARIVPLHNWYFLAAAFLTPASSARPRSGTRSRSRSRDRESCWPSSLRVSILLQMTSPPQKVPGTPIPGTPNGTPTQ